MFSFILFFFSEIMKPVHIDDAMMVARSSRCNKCRINFGCGKRCAYNTGILGFTISFHYALQKPNLNAFLTCSHHLRNIHFIFIFFRLFLTDKQFDAKFIIPHRRLECDCGPVSLSLLLLCTLLAEYFCDMLSDRYICSMYKLI